MVSGEPRCRREGAALAPGPVCSTQPGGDATWPRQQQALANETPRMAISQEKVLIASDAHPSTTLHARAKIFHGTQPRPMLASP